MPDSNLTKRALAQALKGLMEKKPFSRISVGDICEACGMNRKSFYYHFKDKYDLVNWIFTTEYLEFLDIGRFSSGWELFEDLCLYFYQERAFYRPAFQITGQNSFSSFLGEVTTPVINLLMARLYPESGTWKSWDMLVSFFTGVAFPAFFSWLTQQEELDVEEFLETNRRSLERLAKSLLQRKENASPEKEK